MSPWASSSRREPWWAKLSEQPAASDKDLQEFTDRWKFDREVFWMLKGLEPQFCTLVLRDFKPPTNCSDTQRKLNLNTFIDKALKTLWNVCARDGRKKQVAGEDFVDISRDGREQRDTLESSWYAEDRGDEVAHENIVDDPHDGRGQNDSVEQQWSKWRFHIAHTRYAEDRGDEVAHEDIADDPRDGRVQSDSVEQQWPNWNEVAHECSAANPYDGCEKRDLSEPECLRSSSSSYINDNRRISSSEYWLTQTSDHPAESVGGDEPFCIGDEVLAFFHGKWSLAEVWRKDDTTHDMVDVLWTSEYSVSQLPPDSVMHVHRCGADVEVGQRVWGNFYGEWHPAIIYAFISSVEVEVLWDAEYSRSKLPIAHTRITGKDLRTPDIKCSS